jgi:hypothetical protein
MSSIAILISYVIYLTSSKSLGMLIEEFSMVNDEGLVYVDRF